MAESQNIEWKESWRDEYLKWVCGFANCGRLPDNWTAENLLAKHASRPYNPNIANVFYLAGFIESWGRGIEKICNACTENDLPLPEFLFNPGDIMVKYTAPKERIVRGPEKVTERVTEKEMAVLELLQMDPGYTYRDLAEKLKLSRKTVSARMKSLREKGIIERVGSDKMGYWKIRE